MLLLGFLNELCQNLDQGYVRNTLHKKVVLKISENFHRNTRDGVYFLSKVEGQQYNPN